MARTTVGSDVSTDPASPEEPRYTLREAEQMLRVRRCAEAGQHRLTPIQGRIDRVYCPECEQHYDLVHVPDEPEPPADEGGGTTP